MANGTEALQREKVKPIPSHTPGPRGRIGPSGGLEQILKDNIVTPDYRGEGDPTSVQSLASRLMDTPVGNLMMSYFGNGPSLAVAGVGPSQIRALSRQGRNRILDLALRGLESFSQVTLGRAPTIQGMLEYLDRGSTSSYLPNTRLSDEVINQLKIIQERYPRLIGHIKRWSDTPFERKMRFAMDPRAGVSMGASANYIDPATGPTEKFSHMLFDPAAAHILSADDPKSALPFTLGEELLHSADRLTLGNKRFTQAYQNMEDLFGYDANPFEVRAKKFGERMNKIVEKVMMEGGPGTRQRLGKNVRVPK